MENLTILIFLFIIFSPIITKHVKLNFHRDKDIYSDDDEELSMNILQNNIYCDINVGNQNIPFHISFDKEITYIIDNNYTFAKYSKSNSNSFVKKSQNPNSYVFDNIRYGYNARHLNYKMKKTKKSRYQI